MTAYDSGMGKSAAVMVFDHIPDEDEIDEYAQEHAENCDDEFITEISAVIAYEAPEFLSVCERDQINAYMRDGGACVLVLYVTTSDEPVFDDDEEE